MLEVEYEKDFLNKISKIKDNVMKEKIKKKVEKILDNPDIGKPMRYQRRGELYISPFRLSYSYTENKIIFIELYHKDDQ